MKKCRQCSKPATLHITEIREGQVMELHLCETCAQEYLEHSDGPDPGDQVEQLAAKLKEVSEDSDLEELDQLVCPSCEISFREFRNQGRLGCPHCYSAFETELIPLLESIHGETQHCGKYPKRAPDSSQKQFELIKLRNELRQAVEDENYEAAAELRDRIQSMEQESPSQPADSDE